MRSYGDLSLSWFECFGAMDHAYLGKGCSFDMRSYDHAWVDNHMACSSGSHAQSLEKLVNLSLTYQLRMLTSKFKTSNGREIVPLRRHSRYMSITFAWKIMICLIFFFPNQIVLHVIREFQSKWVRLILMKPSY